MNKKKKSLDVRSEQDAPVGDLDVASVEEQLKQVDDPLYAIFQKYSKPLSYLLLFAVVGYFGFNYYENTKEQNLRTSAKLFAELRDSYETVAEIDNEATDSEKASLRKFEGSVSTLKNQPAPYNYIADVYQTMAKDAGDTAKLKAKLQSISLDSSDDQQRIWSELAVLSISRKLLDTNESDFAKSKLKELKNKTVYFKSYLEEMIY